MRTGTLAGRPASPVPTVQPRAAPESCSACPPGPAASRTVRVSDSFSFRACARVRSYTDVQDRGRGEIGMSDHSTIEWTDATWNPMRGCTKISPGCAHCYAETFAERFRGVPGHPFEQGFDLRLVPEALDLPLQWKRSRLIFVNSMSDLFHEDVPDTYIEKVFGVMRNATHHRFQVLTKRAERLESFTL